MVTNLLKQTVVDQLFGEIKEDNLLETINGVLKQFNEIYQYKSKNICEDMLDSDYSESSNSDSDSNSDSNSDNNIVNIKKRKLEDTTSLDNSVDTPTKKPKKN